jgi:hypothetical protein
MLGKHEVHLLWDRSTGSWAVEIDGEVGALLHDKAFAEAAAVEAAEVFRPSSLAIHKQDGSLEEERSFPRRSS